MTLAEIGEDALIARLVAQLGNAPSERLVAGIGDDCAVVKRGRLLELLKTDCVVEGVHFLRSQPARQVGWKALARAISDVGAMGGRPREALVTLAVPADLSVAYLEEFYLGLKDAADRFGVVIVGGETARSPGPIFVSVALTGEVTRRHLVLRSGGKPGDQLYVTGTLGGSIHGKHLTFVPRVVEAQWLVANFSIHAMMDLSDGLGKDLPRLAAASGCGWVVDRATIPTSSPEVSVEAALSDGEDYELLFAVPRQVARRLEGAWVFPVQLTRIGQLTGGGGVELGGGYDHFT